MPDRPLLEIHDVRKTFNAGTVAADRITFDLEEGEVVAILGPSGCGKTTLLRLIAGFERPDGGRIAVRGVPVAGDGIWIPPERRKIGMVFQDYALFPHMTVAANVMFGLSHLPPRQRRERAEAMLSLVELAPLALRYPHELSGGQQQRVAVARALAGSPPLLLLDEPFSGLDADMRQGMRQEVREILKRTGTAGLLVTHDQEEAFDFADRVGVLENGFLHQLDPPEAIYHTPVTRFVADFVGEADFVPGSVGPGCVETELGCLPGMIRFPDGRIPPPGSRVDVMIRPDDIVIDPDRGGSGVIRERRFKGSVTIYTVELPSATVVHASLGSTSVIPIGSVVRVTAEPTHLVLFPPREG